MLSIGALAPEFELADQAGCTHRLSELCAAGPVVVYFYPADFTPVCTKQACMMRDWREDLRASGVRVVGVSAQSGESHGKFDAKHDLGFTLLADPKKHAIAGFGVGGPLGLLPRRATFLLDTDRRVVDRVVADFRVGPHRAFVQRVLHRAGASDRSAE